MEPAPPAGSYHTDEDEKILHKLGYAQELFRAMGGFQNFAISFTIISILAGCLTSYYIAFGQGGPVAVSWGWLLVGGMSIIVSLAMAEIASAFPTAGGLYYWASKLGSPAWGWFTGWFNLIGQIAVTAAIGYGLAMFGTALLNFWFDYPNTKEYIYLLYADLPGAGAGREPDEGELHGVPEHDLGLLAHRGRGLHRDRAAARPGPPPVARLRLQRDGECLRLRECGHELLQPDLLVRVCDRPADGPVHDHGLRRLGAHGRGDDSGLADGRGRHVHVRRRLRRLRVHPARRRDAGDPEHRRCGREPRLPRPLDLDRVDEPELGRGAALHLRRRAVLLRHGVADVGVADAVRVLARRRRARPPALAASRQEPRAAAGRARRSPSCRPR